MAQYQYGHCCAANSEANHDDDRDADCASAPETYAKSNYVCSHRFADGSSIQVAHGFADGVAHRD